VIAGIGMNWVFEESSNSNVPQMTGPWIFVFDPPTSTTPVGGQKRPP
jgi:hypothetical protein